jgi:hypothetical protein
MYLHLQKSYQDARERAMSRRTVMSAPQSGSPYPCSLRAGAPHDAEAE